jgi:hypothetical protein
MLLLLGIRNGTLWAVSSRGGYRLFHAPVFYTPAMFRFGHTRLNMLMGLPVVIEGLGEGVGLHRFDAGGAH